MTTYVIERRQGGMVNTDPQRRCYNGCNFSEEFQWGTWGLFEGEGRNWTKEHAEQRIKFWEDLSEYARKERRQKFAHTQYRVAEYKEGKS